MSILKECPKCGASIWASVGNPFCGKCYTKERKELERKVCAFLVALPIERRLLILEKELVGKADIEWLVEFKDSWLTDEGGQ